MLSYVASVCSQHTQLPIGKLSVSSLWGGGSKFVIQPVRLKRFEFYIYRYKYTISCLFYNLEGCRLVVFSAYLKYGPV